MRIALLLTLLAACGRIDVSVGQSLSHATEFAMTEAFRIGDEATGDKVFLIDDIEVSIDSRGHLYVTDRDSDGVRVFTDTGKLFATIGRAGAGPGEFQGRPHVHLGPQDTLYALDLSANRITVFAPDDYLPAKTINVGEAFSVDESFRTFQMLSGLLGVVPQGFLVRYSTELVPLMSDPDAPNPTGIKLLERGGTLSPQAVCDLPGRVIVHASTGVRSMVSGPLPFGRDAFFALSREDLVYSGHNDSIEISVLSIDGNIRRQIATPHEPVPITAEERALALSVLPDLREELRSLLPDSKPAFLALLVDDAGRIWLRLSTRRDATDARWIVLDQDGNIVAFTMLPIAVWLQVVDGDRAFGVSRVEDSGAPVVVAYDIRS